MEQKQEEAKTEPLKIITQPESVKVGVGDAPYFEIEVTGGKAPYSFAWFIGEEGGGRTVRGVYGIQTKDEPAYGYSEMQVLITENFEYSDANRYFFYCEVTDADGSKVTSNFVDITVESSAFTVTGSSPAQVKPGETVTLKVNASGGTKPYKFLWMGYNEDDYSQGFTTAAIYWSGVTLSADGSTLTIDTSKCEAKEFKCDVTDANGNKQRVEFCFVVR